MSQRSSGPCRPTIPAVAWLAVAAWVGSVAGESLWWNSREGIVLPAAIVITVIAALWVVFVRVRHTRWGALWAIACCGLVLGVGISVLQGVSVAADSELLRDCGAREWLGRVVADPRDGAYGQRVEVRLLNGPCAGVYVSLRWPEGSAPEIGQVVRFKAILDATIDDAEYGRDSVRSGVLGTGRAWTAATEGWPAGVTGALWRWRATAARSCAGDSGAGAALLRGIVLGDRRALRDSAVEEDFRVLGLSHVLAVSGMHLGLVCALVLGVCRIARLPRRLGLLGMVVAGAMFVIVTGMPTSAMRALAMVCVGALAESFGVRRDSIASLSAAVLALLIIAPWGVFSLGLQLSVLAVGGLLLFGSLAQAWSSACGVGPIEKPLGLMSLTCVAQGVTTPVTAPVFGMFSILAPVANAVVLPLLPVALCCGLVGLLVQGAGIAALGRMLVTVAEQILTALAWVVGALASLPGAAVMLGADGLTAGIIAVIISMVVWARWPLPRSMIRARAGCVLTCSALLVFAVGAPVGSTASMIVFDVGQADAILVRDSGRAMLVDAGADGTALRMALAREGVRRLDVIVLTHAHDDHTGGLAGLVGVAQVGWVGVPCLIEPDALEMLEGTVDRLTPRGRVDVRSLSAGQRFSLGHSEVEILWPSADGPTPDNTNDTSVVLVVHRGTFDAVLTGDAEGPVQEALAEAGMLRDVEVLKVPHHGSTNGLSEAGLSAWQPEVAIISVGTDNRFDHPHLETLELLSRFGVRVFRTDRDGDVIIEIGTEGYKVWTRQLCENGRGPPTDHGTLNGRGVCVAIKSLTELKPVYLIWGKEELLLAEAVQRLRERVGEVADLDFNSDTFDGESAEAGAIVSAANTLPFASERRLIIVRGVDKMNAAAQTELAEYSKDPAPTACLVLVATSVSRNSKLFKAVDALGGASEYRAPRRNDYPSWVMSHFSRKGRELSADGAEVLVRAVGRDLRRLDIEAEKIIAYVGDRARIERADVEAVVSETAPTSVFEFLDALGARECGTALSLLADLIDGGESVMGVHAMAVRHVRILLSVRALVDRDASQGEIASEIRATDWQVRNYVRQAGRFEEAELVNALVAAADTEGKMKSGGEDPRLAFERWVVGVCAQ